MTVPKSRARRPDARIARSRAAMQRALLVLLEEMPLEEITGARITERAEVGYATFFRHYADVRALLVDTVTALADDLAQRMMPSLLAADSGAAAAAFIDSVAARKTVFHALLAGAGDALRAELAREVIDRIEALPDISPSWLPRRLATRVAVMSTIELVDWWLREEPNRDPVEVTALLDRLVIDRFAEGL